jgi:hypothetical protein
VLAKTPNFRGARLDDNPFEKNIQICDLVTILLWTSLYPKTTRQQASVTTGMAWSSWTLLPTGFRVFLSVIGPLPLLRMHFGTS